MEVTFLYAFLISVIAKTIDFQNHQQFILFSIFCYRSNARQYKIQSQNNTPSCCLRCDFIVFYRFIMGYEGALFSLTNGPMARLLISQVATFFLHIDAFPTLESFLKGASFNTKFAIVLENAAGD